MFYRVLADAVSAIHLTLMIYVVFGQLLIVLGIVFRWRWIRNPWFRWTHMAVILTIAVEALLVINCPLTDWDEDLRALAGEKTGQETFTARVLHWLLFPEVPAWFLTGCYFGFALLVLVCYLLAPPGLSSPKGRLALRLKCPHATPDVPEARGSVAEVVVERPADGAGSQVVGCPACARPVAIHVRSRGRFWTGVLLIALLGVAVTCLGFFLPYLEAAVTGNEIPLNWRGDVKRTARHTTVTGIGLLLLFLAPSGILLRRALLVPEEATTDPGQRHRLLV
jgi:hypothetical protein